MTEEKTVVYLRTSTKDQNPENQRKDCLGFCREKLGTTGEEVEVIKEKETAWNRSRKRQKFEKLLNRARKGEIDHIVVWDFDRLYRLRKRTVKIVKEMAARGVQVHSVNQQWLEQIHSAPEPWDEILYDLMLQIIGWIGEEESRKRSRRVKAAYERKKNKKNWGRKKKEIPMEKVKELRGQGFSYSDIIEKLDLNISRSGLYRKHRKRED
ncbi:MAG: Site-specific recombinase, DNA invertase Pin-like [Candidatus Methanohalarchaeum thermophilum]|uniref:Site-specific recombinase, DNA invertase Pin-like n=1 Tax=Methanohalarchaeum thermophilum TaxID=1903181 RepID=A0A1Q6DVA8_METT1|nr:MAG: Site-specific recombinase, DNA invertase Pin-like [Candidatus Methanohalarchaeum thermophilum]